MAVPNALSVVAPIVTLSLHYDGGFSSIYLISLQ